MKELSQLHNEVGQKATWTKEELRAKIDEKIEQAKLTRPKIGDVRIYDFFSFNIAKIPHPCVIFRIEDDRVWGIVTSTNESGYHNISKVEDSRCLADGWWTNTIICQSKEDALKGWLGIFDSPAEVKRIVKLLNVYYKNILK